MPRSRTEMTRTSSSISFLMKARISNLHQRESRKCSVIQKSTMLDCWMPSWTLSVMESPRAMLYLSNQTGRSIPLSSGMISSISGLSREEWLRKTICSRPKGVIR